MFALGVLPPNFELLSMAGSGRFEKVGGGSGLPKMSNPDYNEEARKLFSALNLPASGAASGLRLLASLCVETIARG
jgi:hypothetical protein